MRRRLAELNELIEKQGGRGAPIPDVDLDDMVLNVASLTVQLHRVIEPDWLARAAEDLNDDDVARASQLLRAIDHGSSALARLLGLLRVRQAAVEGTGATWEDHLDAVTGLRDLVADIRAAQRAAA